MFSIIIAVAMGFGQMIAVMPKELEIPIRKMFSNKKRKGRNNIPYYARFF